MKVVGNPNGEYRGKLGGTVFSKNKSGAIARQYVKPTQPNSAGQINARNRLGTAAQAYKTISPNQQKNWRAFATKGFNPKKKINKGNQTPNAAFTALYTTALNGAAIGQDGDFVQNSVAIDAVATYEGFAPSLDAPVVGVGAEVKTSAAGCRAVLQVDSATLAASFIPTFNFDIIPVVAASSQFQFLKDDADNSLGLMVTMSTPNTAAGRVYSQLDIQTLGICNAPSGLTGNYTDGPISVSFPVAPNVGDWAVLPSSGQYVMLGLWIVGLDGRSKLIGYSEVAVS